MLVVIVIILAVLGMIAGAILARKGDRRGNVIAIIAAIAGITVALGHSLGLFSAPPEVKERERAFDHIAGMRLGQYVAVQKPGAKVLIILAFEHVTVESRRQALPEGVIEGLGDAATVVGTVDPPLPPEVRDAYESRLSVDREQLPVPLIDDWFTPAYFDELLAEHAGDADVVICMTGLPSNAGKLAFWERPGRPVLAPMFGPGRLPAERITSGDILAAVVHRLSVQHQDAELDRDDLVAAFNRRYLLITAENVDEMREGHARLFSP